MTQNNLIHMLDKLYKWLVIVLLAFAVYFLMLISSKMLCKEEQEQLIISTTRETVAEILYKSTFDDIQN